MACLFVAAGAVLLSAACERDDRALGTERNPPSVRAQRAEAIGYAVDSVVAARCDREVRCNNIGTDRKYASHDACMSSTRAEWRNELNLLECPGGVDQKELGECLNEIRNDDCANPFDSLGRLAACRSSDLCIATP